MHFVPTSGKYYVCLASGRVFKAYKPNRGMSRPTAGETRRWHFAERFSHEVRFFFLYIYI